MTVPQAYVSTWFLYFSLRLGQRENSQVLPYAPLGKFLSSVGKLSL